MIFLTPIVFNIFLVLIDGASNYLLIYVPTVVAKKRKTILLVKLLTKSFYVFWPWLYINNCFLALIFHFWCYSIHFQNYLLTCWEWESNLGLLVTAQQSSIAYYYQLRKMGQKNLNKTGYPRKGWTASDLWIVVAFWPESLFWTHKHSLPWHSSKKWFLSIHTGCSTSISPISNPYILKSIWLRTKIPVAMYCLWVYIWYDIKFEIS